MADLLLDHDFMVIKCTGLARLNQLNSNAWTWGGGLTARDRSSMCEMSFGWLVGDGTNSKAHGS